MKIETNDGCIEIKILNASKLSVNHNLNEINILKGEKGNIEQLIFTKEYGIKLGDTLKIRNESITHNFYVLSITQINSTNFVIDSTRKNKSSIFMLPLIANKNSSDFLNYSSYFFNSYLYCNGIETYNDRKHIFLEYRFFNTDFFYQMEKRISELPGYVKSIQPSSGFTIYIIKIPDQFVNDVKLFTRGRYSSMSSIAKARIIMFHNVKPRDYIAQVLNRDKDLRRKMEIELDCNIPTDFDLLTKPDISDETLFYNICVK